MSEWVVFGFGFLIGLVSALSILGIVDVVIVHGTKSAIQTVDWKEKTYKLVPLDQK